MSGNTRARSRDSAAKGRSADDRAPTLPEAFRRLACGASNYLGSPWAFIAAVCLITGWAISGPFFKFADGWQLVINTGTTIITFLMVFLIQSTQNRDAKAIHLKLDELIRASKARNVFADLENATEEELDEFKREFERLRMRGLTANEAAAHAQTRTVQSGQAEVKPTRSNTGRRVR